MYRIIRSHWQSTQGKKESQKTAMLGSSNRKRVMGFCRVPARATLTACKTTRSRGTDVAGYGILINGKPFLNKGDSGDMGGGRCKVVEAWEHFILTSRDNGEQDQNYMVHSQNSIKNNIGHVNRAGK